MKSIIKTAGFLFLISFMALSCKKEHNHTEIEILSPTDESTIANASAVNIKITLTADEELHDVEISLKKEADTTYIAPFNPMDLHQHSKTVTVDETVDLSSYPAGTEFHLEVEACEDHDCEEKVKKSIHFRI